MEEVTQGVKRWLTEVQDEMMRDITCKRDKKIIGTLFISHQKFHPNGPTGQFKPEV